MKLLLLVSIQLVALSQCCPSGYFSFGRPSIGRYCMAVFPAAPTVGFEQARAACKAQGAELSGIDNGDEMMAMQMMAGTKQITGSVWIGAKRTAACTGKKLSATCSQKTAFAWTDGLTTGTDGFTWLDSSQPDNAHGSTQNCIVAFFAPANVVYKGVTWRPGAMDDTACDTTQFAKTGPRVVGGYVCGRKP